MSDNGPKENRMPDIPGMPHNFEGYPEYEEKLKNPCFYTGKICGRTLCPRWVASGVQVPSRLVPGQFTMYTFHQCKDDQIDNALLQLTMVIQQMMKGAQERQNNELQKHLGIDPKKFMGLG